EAGSETPLQVAVGGAVLLAEDLRARQLALVRPLEFALLHRLLREVEVDAERELADRLREDEEREHLVRLEAQEHRRRDRGKHRAAALFLRSEEHTSELQSRVD